MASFLKAAALAALVSTVAADSSFPSITAKGSKFFYPNGTQFFIKGVAYQQDVAAAGKTSSNTKFKDPLADADNCKRDVPLLTQLGTNTIRTYAIDPTADHSDCMKLLQEANIYVISDLSQPNESINRDDPQWTTDLYQRYTDVVDELAQYPNVIGFFAGNEVSNNKTNTGASAFVKAAVRDTKKYIADKHDRWMGVGYAANDDATIRDDIAHYFNCGDATDAIDFWGYNIYSWCGNSNLQDSGYDTQAEFFSKYSVPVFFAEYGCNTGATPGAANRKFTETAALYGTTMAPVFSGGIVYMYFEEDNDFGLVKATTDGGPVTKLADFQALSTQVHKADPKGIDESSYTPDGKAADCPSLSSDWQANSDLPPTPDQSLCDCMVAAASCVPSKGLATKDYGDLFDYICSADGGKNCVGIKADSEKGIYGAYSMCEPKAKLAYVLDTYYKSQNSASTACDFKGQATTQTGSDSSNCKDSLAAASSVNSQVATATAAVSQPTDGSDSADSMGASNGAALSMLLVISASVGAGMMMMF